MFKNIYNGKKVLITGHTGFKGSWLSEWLLMLGAEVIGYSLEPNTTPALFDVLNLKSHMTSIIGDIRDKENLNKVFKQYNPEIVFHLAAQPLVRLSYFEPVETYEINIIGALNVLEAARKTSSVKAFVNVTTDKCYENREKDYAYKEEDPMGGYDMYSSSKGCSEILTSSYRRSFLNGGVPFALASARAGNVIGGGDWASDRLLPDCARALAENKTITIRNPKSVRPWQHVLEPLSGYLLLGEKLLEYGSAFAEGFNFGPYTDDVLTVGDIAQLSIKYWGSGNVEIMKTDNLHEATLLQLNIEKAINLLGFKPVFHAETAIKFAIDWYNNFYKNNQNMAKYTQCQIEEYVNSARKMGIEWSSDEKCITL